MPLLPGAEPYRHDGGETGVLLCHGFTGSPRSMRPWAEYLAARGLTVRLPLLPGHGTRWQDLRVTGWQDWYAEVDRELRALTGRCSRIFVFGLSMGATLALRLAARHGPVVNGVVLVNPSVKADGVKVLAVRPLRHVVASVPWHSSDIALPGVLEGAYDRVPLDAVRSLTELWRLVRADLPRVTQPLLLFNSRVDHVVHRSNAELVAERISSADLTRRVLEDSYHVATLDRDAEEIFAASLAFVRRLAPVGGRDAGTPGDGGPAAGAPENVRRDVGKDGVASG